MSDLVIFAVGAIIFAITVYGTVMTGGLLLTRKENAENRDVRGGIDEAMIVPLPPKET